MATVVGSIPSVVAAEGFYETADPGDEGVYELTTAPTEGNTLVVVVARGSGQALDLAGVSDDDDGAWSRIATLDADDTDSDYADSRIEVWASFDVGAPTEITVDYDSSWGTDICIMVVELAGVHPFNLSELVFDGYGTDDEFTVDADYLDASTVQAVDPASLSLLATFTESATINPPVVPPVVGVGTDWGGAGSVAEPTSGSLLSVFTKTLTEVPRGAEAVTIRRWHHNHLASLKPTCGILLSFGSSYALESGETFTSLKTAAIELADMTNSAFISATEWERWANHGMRRLYDLLVRSYEDYFEREVQIETVAGQGDYQLPADMYKLLAVDVSGGGADDWLPLKPYHAAERARYTDEMLQTWTHRRPGRYRVVDNFLRVRPTPTSVDTVRVRYIPVPRPLVATVQEYLPNKLMEHWSEYISLFMAIQALRKEESNTQELRGELAVVEQNIRAAAAERNVGDTLVVADVRGVVVDEFDECEW